MNNTNFISKNKNINLEVKKLASDNLILELILNTINLKFSLIKKKSRKKLNVCFMQS